MIPNKLLLELASIFTCLVTVTVAREAIVGGDACNPGNCVYMVSVQHNRQHFCDGGIIGKRTLPYIISAAHCFFDDDNKFVKRSTFIVAGTYDIGPNRHDGVPVQVKRIYMPKHFRPSQGSVGDIAVLELNHILPITMNMIVLRLPKNGEKYVNREKANVAGWGWQYIVSRDNGSSTTYSGGRNDSGLRFAEAIVLRPNDPHQCRNTDLDKQICARIKPQTHRVRRGTCHGDSGSPLVFNGNYVIGVLSIGPSNCDETSQGSTYTKVSYYRAFVEAVMKQKKNTMKIVVVEHNMI